MTPLSPGSKGWIKKYFDLVNKGLIRLRGDVPENVDLLRFIRVDQRFNKCIVVKFFSLI